MSKRVERNFVVVRIILSFLVNWKLFTFHPSGNSAATYSFFRVAKITNWCFVLVVSYFFEDDSWKHGWLAATTSSMRSQQIFLLPYRFSARFFRRATFCIARQQIDVIVVLNKKFCDAVSTCLLKTTHLKNCCFFCM